MIYISYTVEIYLDQDQIFHTFELQTVPLVLKALFTIHHHWYTTLIHHCSY